MIHYYFTKTFRLSQNQIVSVQAFEVGMAQTYMLLSLISGAVVGRDTSYRFQFLIRAFTQENNPKILWGGSVSLKNQNGRIGTGQ